MKGTVSEAEVENAGRRGKAEARAKKKKTIQIKAYASTCAYSKACTKACSINKLDPREQSWAGRIGPGRSYVFISVASNSSKHLLVPRASLIKHCGQCCTLFWFLPSVFVLSRLLLTDLVICYHPIKPSGEISPFDCRDFGLNYCCWLCRLYLASVLFSLPSCIIPSM